MVVDGAPNTNRTCDLPLRRGLLYPLSYRGAAGEIIACTSQMKRAPRRAPVGGRRNVASSPALHPRLAVAVHRDGRAGRRLGLHPVIPSLVAIHHVVILGAA